MTNSTINVLFFFFLLLEGFGHLDQIKTKMDESEINAVETVGFNV